MKVFRIVSGISLALIGITMMIFAWYFFFEEDIAIIQLASLYIALFISVLIITIGGMCITFRKGN